MSKMIQIRNVPDAIHRRLKARAAMSGLSMSDFVLREIKKALVRPSRQELLDRISQLPESRPEPPPEDVVRQERDSR